MAQADLPVVGVVGRGDLEEARGEPGLGVGAVGVGHHHVVVGDDRDLAADDRQGHGLADQRLGAGIGGVDGDGGVAEHRLGTGGGDGDVAAAVGQRVPQVPHVTGDVLVLDLVVGERGAGDRIPVDEPFAAVDQAVAEQHEEGVADRRGAHLVHREPGAPEVARSAHRDELFDDDLLVLVLPLLGLRDERVAAHRETPHAFGQQPLLDDRLGGDARMIGARHPQGLVAAHAVVPDEHVLERVVEGVSEVQRGGDVGGRDDDRIGRRAVADGFGVEDVAGCPGGGHRRLGVGGGVGLGQLGEAVDGAHSAPQGSGAGRHNAGRRRWTLRAPTRRSPSSCGPPRPSRTRAPPAGGRPCPSRRCGRGRAAGC